MCAAVPSSENSCKNADYILLKCCLTDVPLLCVTFNAYQMLLKHCIQLHNNKNQEQSNCYIQLKSQFLEAIFIFHCIYDGAITFFHFYFIFNCICKKKKSYGSHNLFSYKDPFREQSYGWLSPVCLCFLQLVSLYSLLRKVSAGHRWANDWSFKYSTPSTQQTVSLYSLIKIK